MMAWLAHAAAGRQFSLGLCTRDAGEERAAPAGLPFWDGSLCTYLCCLALQCLRAFAVSHIFSCLDGEVLPRKNIAAVRLKSEQYSSSWRIAQYISRAIPLPTSRRFASSLHYFVALIVRIEFLWKRTESGIY